MSALSLVFRSSLVSVYTATKRPGLVLNVAMNDAALAVHYASCYGEASRLASRSSGRERCMWAGVASAYARRARKATALHNELLRSLR